MEEIFNLCNHLSKSDLKFKFKIYHQRYSLRDRNQNNNFYISYNFGKNNKFMTTVKFVININFLYTDSFVSFSIINQRQK